MVSVQLTSTDDMGAMLRAKTHWFVVFDAAGLDYMDAVDNAVGLAPNGLTFPTALCPSKYGVFSVTIVPKTDRSQKQMLKAMSKATGTPVEGGNPDKDVFLAAQPESVPAINAFLTEMAGDTTEC